jgi:SpoVK/Ycf46/Vps4 family AAA+-type ATPase
MSDPGRAMLGSEQVADPQSGLQSLIPALRRLDRLLDQLVSAAQAKGGIGVAALRGMYVSPEEAAQLLVRSPCAPSLVPIDGDACRALVEPAAEPSALSLLQRWFGLSSFDLDVVLIALAPELDLRYERLYGYLQDDLTRRHATVDLALNLRCSSAAEKMARLAHFAPDAPLIRHDIVHLVADPNQVQPLLLGLYLKLDQQIVAALLGHSGLDARLASFCRFVDPGPGLDRLQLGSEIKHALRILAEYARDRRQRLTLYFQGPQGAGKSAAARALASELGMRLLHAELSRIGDLAMEFDANVTVLFREAWLKDAILYVDGIDALRCEERAILHKSLLGAPAPREGITILSGRSPWMPPCGDPLNLIDICFGTPDFALRRSCWQANLVELGVALTEPEIDALAGRFRLTAGQIAQAAASARNRALWRSALASTAERRLTETELLTPKPVVAELFVAARAQGGNELARLARKIKPKQGWRDIAVPPDQALQLREICDQARLRQVVYGDWGFGRKLSIGKGLNALFVGPPGTGKTMAAEIIAKELELDLYKIDLSQVISKYIGETSKNLDRIFSAAESANAILFFDEADALFGKRSEVKDSHDRYANIEIGYLLQKMEEYEGVAILATNLRQNLDEAFLRRLQSIVEFPFPDEEYRRRIWEVTFPCEAPVAEDVDFSRLACEVRLAGGNIKNIALTAAFYAAASDGTIKMEHITRAARREHQKLGRKWGAPTGPDR